MQTLIVFLIIFSIIVVIHEFGHFYFARRAGILVREFAIGMGPKLFAKQGKDGTAYTVRMLPMGGYVRLAGMNEEEAIRPGMEVGLQLDDQNMVTSINTTDKAQEDELPVRVDQLDLVEGMTLEGIPMGEATAVTYNVSRTAKIIEADGTVVQVAPLESLYESAGVLQKILTNFAGPMNNFILSIIAFTIVGFMLPSVPNTSSVVGAVIEDSPAEQAGLQMDDKIIEIDGTDVSKWTEVTANIQPRPGETLPIEIERAGETLSLEVAVNSVATADGEQSIGQIGISASQSTSFMSRLLYGVLSTWGVLAGVVGVLVNMITGGFDINMFGGPVAMAEMTGEVVTQGFVTVTYFLAYLSANLGIVNLLPIPALDGGKILLNLFELFRGKPLSQEKEGIITIIGVVFLLILMVAVTWNDISRAFF